MLVKYLAAASFALLVTTGAAHKVSQDGNCGNGVTCRGSMFGGCCSASGKCGATREYCGSGCQLRYGYCHKTAGEPSPDGTCGGTTGFTCKGSGFGDCCSQYHFCGSSKEHCGVGCEHRFGKCSTPKNSGDLHASSTTKRIAPRATTMPEPESVVSSSMSPAIPSVFSTVTTDSAITTITPNPSTTGNATAVSSSRASNSLAICPTASSFDKRQDNQDGEDCVPCEGQSGSLPYCGATNKTDHYQFTPKTCRTVYYEFNITNATVAPDGIERIGFLLNGQMPGPLIEANWGDTIVVKVNNQLTANGTSIHFHGIRQLNSSEYDGVPSITQCPIAPGDSFTYKFIATNYGTSWYHGHYAIQAWMGVFGPMIIHGPTSKEYDVDAGTIILNDWTHKTVDSLYDAAQDAEDPDGGPRVMDNGLINGMNTWGVDGTANQTGQRFELLTQLEPDKTYLFRIINGAMQSTFKFYIDGHELEVINMDFTNIVPYKTKILNINEGQRYMVLVKADQPAGNYWMRADNQNACDKTIQADDIKAIVRYAGNNTGDMPTSTKYNYTGECVDEPLSSLVPIAKLNPVSSDVEFVEDVTLDKVNSTQGLLYKWKLSGTTFMSHYEDPSLVHVLENNTVPTYAGDLVLDLPEMGKWVYIIVESAMPVNHPIHLHGHDFYILAAGKGTYSKSTPLNFDNPPRRDTANMPAGGFLVLAFLTDNPGIWLMHCHIGWHTSEGFALQLVEGLDLIEGTVKDQCGLYDTCAKWDDWVEETGFHQHDSGV